MRDTLAYQVQIRQSELWAEAERDRLVSEAQQGQPRTGKSNLAVLASIGRGMVAVGSAMEMRFSASEPDARLNPCADAS